MELVKQIRTALQNEHEIDDIVDVVTCDPDWVIVLDNLIDARVLGKLMLKLPKEWKLQFYMNRVTISYRG